MTDDRCTDLERTHVRNELLLYMEAHPLHIPLSVRFLDTITATAAYASGFMDSGRARAAVAAFAVVFVVGLGTSYAAANALPGDLLYNVKLAVNERVAAALAFGPQGKAQYDAELAGLRLKEAETLAARNELTPASSALITADLSQVTSNFNANIAALATSSNSGVALASAMQSGLEATLVAHEQVLEALSKTIPDASSSLSAISIAVDQHLAAARAARKRINGDFDASSTDSLNAVAAQTQRSAVRSLSSVQALVPQVAGGFGTDTSSYMNSQAETVRQALSAGEAQLSHGSARAAISAFQSAIQTASETETTVSTALQLKKIVPNLPLPANATSSESIDISDLGDSATGTGGIFSSSSPHAATYSRQSSADTEAVHSNSVIGGLKRKRESATPLEQ